MATTGKNMFPANVTIERAHEILSKIKEQSPRPLSAALASALHGGSLAEKVRDGLIAMGLLSSMQEGYISFLTPHQIKDLQRADLYYAFCEGCGGVQLHHPSCTVGMEERKR